MTLAQLFRRLREAYFDLLALIVVPIVVEALVLLWCFLDFFRKPRK